MGRIQAALFGCLNLPRIIAIGPLLNVDQIVDPGILVSDRSGGLD
jgi:hypothetical protein